MKTKLLIVLISLIPALALACPEAIRFGDPCNTLRFDPETVGLSVYQDYNDKRCTKALLYDGTCPDYLNGGCAFIGECDLILEQQNKHKITVFTSYEALLK